MKVMLNISDTVNWKKKDGEIIVQTLHSVILSGVSKQYINREIYIIKKLIHVK